jgi:uncharacterized damage-inducible protein DinB
VAAAAVPDGPVRWDRWTVPTRSRRTDPGPRPTDADGFRDAWADLEVVWPQTIARATALPPDLLHERVKGEWSFIQTLRHLLFVTDAWASRALLGDASPYHPLDLPPTGMKNSAIPNDLVARPSLDEILPLREERLAVVRSVMQSLTDEALAEATVRVRGPGYPRQGTYPVSRCVQALVGEHWHHRQYAERDLAVLEASLGSRG